MVAGVGGNGDDGDGGAGVGGPLWRYPQQTLDSRSATHYSKQRLVVQSGHLATLRAAPSNDRTRRAVWTDPSTVPKCK